jgi:hypothetical protein
MGHHELKVMTSMEIAPNDHHLIFGTGDDVQLKRISTIKVPNLVRLDPVKA